MELGWIANFGATNHYPSSASNIQDRSKYSGNEKVYIGNGTGINIENAGKSSFSTSNAIFHFKNVLHIPTITKNLLLVSQFSKDNQCYFEFHPFHCFVKDQQTRRVLL